MDIRKGNSIINKAQVFVTLAIIFMDIFCWGGIRCSTSPNL